MHFFSSALLLHFSSFALVTVTKSLFSLGWLIDISLVHLLSLKAHHPAVWSVQEKKPDIKTVSHL